jgi:hypothetical protein
VPGGDERNRPIFQLRGEFAETGDLPVTSFHDARRARRHLGLTIPESFLVRVDEVIK